jgi:hypothetical protein
MHNCSGKRSIQEKEDFFHQLMDSNLRKKLEIGYNWSIAFFGAKTWTLRKVDQKYLESLELWFWIRLETNWTDHVRNKEVLHRVKEARNVLYT